MLQSVLPANPSRDSLPSAVHETDSPDALSPVCGNVLVYFRIVVHDGVHIVHLFQLFKEQVMTWHFGE